MNVRYVLFDLDGTLCDSADGILRALRAALDDEGLPRLDAATERALIGPPFYQSLPALIGPDRVWPVIERYRTHYATTMFDARCYDGVRELIDALSRRHVVLAVATSKAEFYARPVVEHLGLSSYFATVVGDTLDGARATKTAVIAESLRRLGNPDPASAIMIGDRAHDVVGALANGVAPWGAAWGYGGVPELRSAGATEVFDRPNDLHDAFVSRCSEGDVSVA